MSTFGGNPISTPSKKKPKRHPVSNHRPVVMFLAKCLVFWAVALVLVSRVSAVEAFGIQLTLQSLQAVLGVIGQTVQRHGDSIYAFGTSVQIVADCSPHMPFLIFAAVILAFPSTWRQRLLGLLFGAIILHAFNIVRIITLIRILSIEYAWFEFAHVYLWQTGTILMVFATFALWIRTVSPPAKTAKPT